jgi:hypothetical protein
MKTKIEIKHKGVSVWVTRATVTKGGAKYEEFTVRDYTSGKLVRHVRSNVEEAREKARDVAEALATGQRSEREVIVNDDLRADVRRAIDLVKPLGIDLYAATRKFCDAVRVLDGKADGLMAAVTYWKSNGPKTPFTPKDLGHVVDEFMARKGSKLSEKRKRTLRQRLHDLAVALLPIKVHEVTPVKLEDYMNSRPWCDLTWNVSLGDFRMFFQDAVKRGHAPADPTSGMTRRRGASRNRSIGTLTPGMVKRMLATMAPDLRVPFALWCFAGLRKEELARLTWDTLRTSLSTGYICISAEVGIKTGARDVPLESNLREWIVWRLNSNPNASGYVLPDRCRARAAVENLGRAFCQAAKVRWVPNGARHSYITYRLRRDKSVADVASAAGNSLEMIEKHYFNKSPEITEALAAEYFGIVPAGVAENLVGLEVEAMVMVK